MAMGRWRRAPDRVVLQVAGAAQVPSDFGRFVTVGGVGGWLRFADAAEQYPVICLRIAAAHHLDAERGGVTAGYCHECGWRWPCSTYLWATGHADPAGPWEQ